MRAGKQMGVSGLDRVTTTTFAIQYVGEKKQQNIKMLYSSLRFYFFSSSVTSANPFFSKISSSLYKSFKDTSDF